MQDPMDLDSSSQTEEEDRTVKLPRLIETREDSQVQCFACNKLVVSQLEARSSRAQDVPQQKQSNLQRPGHKGALVQHIGS